MAQCYLCKNKVKKLIDLGMQPICNRFLKEKDEPEYKHPLIVGQCQTCSLVQLINPAPATELKPHYEWITYVEAEEHLDSLAETIYKLPGISSKSKILGISFKDDSLLERLRKKGFSSIYRLDTKEDLGVSDQSIGVETIQGKFNLDTVSKIINKHGNADIIIARHILEHSHNLNDFIKTLKKLVSQNGYIVIEVPDCESALDKLDYAAIWEEHLIYFTPQTFKQMLTFMGFEIAYYEKVRYPLENSLVVIAKPKEPTHKFLKEETLLNEKQRAENFSNNFNEKKANLQSFFSNYKKNKGKIALLGAGHLACGFINFMGLKDYIEFVADDDPNKKGLFMPGSNIPIYGSDELINKNIKLCLLSLNPRHEEKVIQKNQEFIKTGGNFSSIFSDSKYALLIDKKTQGYKDLNLKKISDEVFYTSFPIAKIDKRYINFLKEKYKSNKRKRVRLCVHKDANDAVHEMVILLGKETYIRPHKHINKSESFHIIEGSVNVIIFDESGNINEVIELGDRQSGKSFYYRLSEALYHTVIVTSDYVIFQETTSGPFKKENTLPAPWSPKDTNIKAYKQYMKRLLNSTNLSNYK